MELSGSVTLGARMEPARLAVVEQSILCQSADHALASGRANEPSFTSSARSYEATTTPLGET